MPKVINAKTWQLVSASDGRRYSKYPDGNLPTTLASWNLPATINVPAGTSVGVRQYAVDADGWTIAVTGLAAGLSYNSGTERIEAADTTAASGTATFTLSKSGESDVVDTAIVALTVTADLPAATLFVQDDGSDENAGTEVAPFATLQAAISAAVDGDIIEMRKAGGGVWTTTQQPNISRHFSGANPVTVRVREGDEVRFYPAGDRGTAGALFDVASAQGVRFTSGLGTLKIGNTSLWSTAGGGSDTYPQLTAVTSALSYVENLTFSDIDFSGATGYPALEFRGPSDGNSSGGDRLVIDGCSFYGHRNIKYGAGDHLQILGMGQTKVSNCRFKYAGGHDSLAITATFGEFAVRGCVFDHNWDGATPENTGYRIASFNPAQAADAGVLDYKSSKKTGIIENNLFFGDRNAVTRATNSATYKLAGNRLIFRFNYLWRNWSFYQQFIENFKNRQDHGIEHMRVYHNTHHNAYNILTIDATGIVPENSTGLNHKDCRWINNIYSDITPVRHATDLWAGWGDTPYVIVARRMANVQLQGYPDHWLGAKFDGNMFDVNDPDNFRIQLRSGTGAFGSVVGAATVVGLAAAQSQWPDVFLPSNSTDKALFVNAPTGAEEATRDDFELTQASPGRGGAVPMAVVLSGSTGTTVELSDAYWIYDGYMWGEEGDRIAFYDSTGTTLKGIRQVLSVDTQQQASLVEAITVAAGDRVFLVDPRTGNISRNVGANQT